MGNMLGACAKSGARLVFADNLYMYGPQTPTLTEDTPLTNYRQKPSVRTEITQLWQRAQKDGLVRAVAVRAPDFTGQTCRPRSCRPWALRASSQASRRWRPIRRTNRMISPTCRTSRVRSSP